MGLALSRRLIDLMGGTLTVDSALGQGTTVVIEMKAAKRPAREQTDAGVTAPRVPELETHHTVLYVEDTTPRTCAWWNAS